MEDKNTWILSMVIAIATILLVRAIGIGSGEIVGGMQEIGRTQRQMMILQSCGERGGILSDNDGGVKIECYEK